MKERKKRPLSTAEDTFQAIEHIAEEIPEIAEPFIEPIELGVERERIERGLFEITGIEPVIEPVPEVPTIEIEAPITIAGEMAPPSPLVPPTPTKPAAKVTEITLEYRRPTKKLKVVPKRRGLIIDQEKEIPDKEMTKRNKIESIVAHSDIKRVTVFNKLPFLNLFAVNNRTMRQRKL